MVGFLSILSYCVVSKDASCGIDGMQRQNEAGAISTACIFRQRQRKKKKKMAECTEVISTRRYINVRAELFFALNSISSNFHFFFIYLFILFFVYIFNTFLVRHNAANNFKFSTFFCTKDKGKAIQTSRQHLLCRLASKYHIIRVIDLGQHPHSDRSLKHIKDVQA